MKKKLAQMNGKQRAWVDEYIRTGDSYQATAAVYKPGSRKAALGISTRELNNLDFSDLLELSGVTDKRLTDKINSGLDASYTIRDKKTGEVIDTASDFTNQHRYLETALKLKGLLDPPETNVVVTADKMIVLNTVPINTTEPTKPVKPFTDH